MHTSSMAYKRLGKPIYKCTQVHRYRNTSFAAITYELIIHYTVQLTGNVACRYSRVPQWNPLRGPNADIPCKRPASNCVDNRHPREYF